MDLIQQLLVLLTVTDRTAYNVLDRKIAALENAAAKNGYCFCCGRPDPAFVSGTKETACCQDELEPSKRAVLANLKKCRDGYLEKALENPRAAFII